MRPKGRNTVTEKGLTNEQAVVLALSLLGAELRIVDTEDVAVKADEIAPGRFRWRKYPQYINNELVHTSLRDAKRLSNLVRGAGSDGWQLTTAGMELAAELQRRAFSIEPRRHLDPQSKAWAKRERGRLLTESAFKKIETGEAVESIPKRDIDRFFRLDEYVTGEIRSARVQRILNSFLDDAELGPIVRALAERALKGSV